VELVEVQVNAWERFALSAQDRLQDRPDDRAGKSDVERSQCSGSGALRQLGRTIDSGEDITRVLVEGCASRRERDAAFRPCEQADVELPFERDDLLAQRRLDDVQTLCRTAEVHLLRDGDEVPEMAELHQSTLCVGRFNNSTVTVLQPSRIESGKATSQEHLPLAGECAASLTNAECACELEAGEPSEGVVGVRRRLWNAELLERRSQAGAELARRSEIGVSSGIR
jgi:hypothetical protein